MSGSPQPHFRAWLALLAVCIVWGTTYLANKIGVSGVPPLFFSALRQILAGTIILGTFVVRRRFPWGDLRYLRFQSWIGFLMLSIGNGLSLVALRYLESGMAALLSASLPFVMVGLALVLRTGERITWLSATGILLGMAGIVFMSRDELGMPGRDGYGWGLLFLLLALTGWAYGSLDSKTRSWPYPVLLNAGIQMLAGGSLTLVVSTGLESWGSAVWSADVLWSLAYLVFVGSLVGYTAYLYALTHLPTTVVSIYAYINPLIALVVGWAILDERLDATVGVASLLILGGVFLVNRDYQRQRKRVRIP